jgi:hypothetical protein
MRSWYAALTAGFTIMALAACVTPSIPIPPPHGPPPKPGDPVELPQTLERVSQVCRWAESAGNAPAAMQPDQKMMHAMGASARHKHISIVNWKLVPEQTWIKMFHRQGSAVKFNPELSYSTEIDRTSGYSEMELLDFRLVNGDRAPATVKIDMTAEQLCHESAPETVGGYFEGPLLLSVWPLQNAEETDISEHVMVYAPLKMQLRDGVRDWWVLLIWHVRPKDECAKLPDPKDRDSCLALLEIADLDPSQYSQRVPELLSRVKYPYMYVKSATRSHNGIIHGIL